MDFENRIANESAVIESGGDPKGVLRTLLAAEREARTRIALDTGMEQTLEGMEPSCGWIGISSVVSYFIIQLIPTIVSVQS